MSAKYKVLKDRLEMLWRVERKLSPSANTYVLMGRFHNWEAALKAIAYREEGQK